MAVKTSGDRAGQSYWEQVWQGQRIPSAINPHSRRLRNHMYSCFHTYFERAFADRPHKNQDVLEVGCGRSRWLPYLAKEFGFNVSGIDYSPVGCDQAEAILAAAHVNGRIVHADLFSPPA